jgi:hypothetical protein
VGEGRGRRGNSRGISIIGGLAIGSTATMGSRMGIDIPSTAHGRGAASCTSSSVSVGTTASVMSRSTGCGTTFFNRLRDSSLNSFRDDKLFRFAATFATLYSVGASVGHTSAVTNGDVGSLSQTDVIQVRSCKKGVVMRLRQAAR